MPSSLGMWGGIWVWGHASSKHTAVNWNRAGCKELKWTEAGSEYRCRNGLGWDRLGWALTKAGEGQAGDWACPTHAVAKNAKDEVDREEEEVCLREAGRSVGHTSTQGCVSRGLHL